MRRFIGLGLLIAAPACRPTDVRVVSARTPTEPSTTATTATIQPVFHLARPLPASGIAMVEGDGPARLADLDGGTIGTITGVDLDAWFRPPQPDLLVHDRVTSYRVTPGATEPRPEPTSTVADTVYDCAAVDHRAQATLTICNNLPGVSTGEPVIKLEVGGRTHLVARAPFPPAAGGYGGHWAWARLSPDGRTVLAQYSGECEVPNAFLVPAAGGPLRTPDGSARAQPKESVALGWAPSGDAIVLFPAAACGDGIARPGIYRVAPDSRHRSLIAACDECLAVMWTPTLP